MFLYLRGFVLLYDVCNVLKSVSKKLAVGTILFVAVYVFMLYKSIWCRFLDNKKHYIFKSFWLKKSAIFCGKFRGGKKSTFYILHKKC